VAQAQENIVLVQSSPTKELIPMENFGSFCAATFSATCLRWLRLVHQECFVCIVDAVAITKLFLQHRISVHWRLALAHVAAQRITRVCAKLAR